jgi:serine protease Do
MIAPAVLMARALQTVPAEPSIGGAIMAIACGRPIPKDIPGHTRAVTFRRPSWLSLAAFALPFLGASASLAQVGEEQAAHRKVADAARGVAAAADDAADRTLPPQTQNDPSDPAERARQGVVLLERGGKVIALGTVLGRDGRILTALSPLTHGNNIDARFADGTTSRVRLGHTDRGWDLALLIPQNTRWQKGLKPSKKQPALQGLALRSFSHTGDKNLAVARTIVKGTDTLVGGDSTLLRDALDLASRVKPSELGAPILDDAGDVVAVVARACDPNVADECKQVPYGVPVTAIKAFLRAVPNDAVPPAPWLGIQGMADDMGPVRGVRVLGVHPESPAAAAGLRGGSDKQNADVVVAVDGVPVPTPEALAEAINQRAVGDSVDLLLFGRGRFRSLSLVLRPVPDETQGPGASLREPQKPRKSPLRPR